MRSVTKQAIREARLKEIKEELLHSEKLKVRGCGGGTERGGSRASLFLEAGGKAVGVRGGELGGRPCLSRSWGGSRPRVSKDASCPAGR